MNSLTLDKALELYEILGAHIHEVEDDDDGIDALEFIGKIIRNINESERYENYTLSIEIMSDKTLNNLQEMRSDDILNLFIDGLILNKILNLVTFCKDIGYKHG
ncbi:MAG: hypothetical protein ACXACY_25970 [Candidatus Hodarchaeales archaeon]|jgi:hypothetical protein